MTSLDFATLHKIARVPDHLVPWGKNKSMNAHRIEGTTFLFHVCMEGLHRVDLPEEGYGGYTVMDDNPGEVAKHFNAVRHARGRVLKTGLGLGCFVRMCLTKPEVEHIDVIEKDQRIAEHFGSEFADNPRVTIHVADAFEWNPEGRHWDYGWHDIYCDGNDGLQLLHTKLICRYAPHCIKQGAWQLPRWAKRMVEQAGT